MAEQRVRDSWNVWRKKVDLRLDEYDPSVIEGVLDEIDKLEDEITGIKSDISNLKNAVDTLSDILNGIYPLLALGDVTMYQNMKEIFDEMPST